MTVLIILAGAASDAASGVETERPCSSRPSVVLAYFSSIIATRVLWCLTLGAFAALCANVFLRYPLFDNEVDRFSTTMR
jgi:hypothetical protein